MWNKHAGTSAQDAGTYNACCFFAQHMAQGLLFGLRHTVASVHIFGEHAQQKRTCSMFASVRKMLHKDVQTFWNKTCCHKHSCLSRKRHQKNSTLVARAIGNRFRDAQTEAPCVRLASLIVTLSFKNPPPKPLKLSSCHLHQGQDKPQARNPSTYIYLHQPHKP